MQVLVRVRVVSDFRLALSQTSLSPPFRMHTLPSKTASVSGPAKSKLERVGEPVLQAWIHSL